MSNATVSRLGQADKAGDALALFIKVFAGEVLTAFETTVLMKSLTRQRVIQNGKSASFPAIHKAATEYHVPGTEISGDQIAHNEVIINIDDLLLSHAFIANIDEAMNHYDVRAPYSTELGRALALAYDRNVSRNVIRAARGAALFTGDEGGSAITAATAGTDATVLADSIIAAKEAMDSKDVAVDTTQVNATLKPSQWYLLASDKDRVLNTDVGGDGSFSKGTFSMVGGVSVHKSNALPWGTDDSLNANIPTSYRIDMATTVGAVFTEAATATVQLMGLSMESEYDIRRQGTLMVAKYAVGHGPLLNKCAVEIKTA